jgi:hypothetical protein
MVMMSDFKTQRILSQQANPTLVLFAVAEHAEAQKRVKREVF